MKRVIIALCILFLSGCLERTELDKLGLVAGLGIDKIESGYLITAQIINPSSVVGDGSSALPVYTITMEGETIYEAYQKMDTISNQVLYMAHLNSIVVDESVAREGLNHVLDFALRHTEIRPDITLLVAKNGSASHVLNILTTVDDIPANKLNVFLNMSDFHAPRLTSHNLYDVVNLMNTPGVNAVINTVSIIEGEEVLPSAGSNGGGDSKSEPISGSTLENVQSISSPVKLALEDLAVFNKDQLIGYFNPDEGQYYNILRGENRLYFLKTKLDDQYYISMEIESTETKVKTDIKERRVTIDCSLKGVLVEGLYPMDFSNKSNVSSLEKKFEERLKEDLMTFVKKTQQEFNADVIGIGERAYYKDNKNWSAVEGYWDEVYPELTFTINVEVHLKSVGAIENIKH